MAFGSHNCNNINRIWQYFVWKVTYRRVIKKKLWYLFMCDTVKSYCVLKMSENKEKIRYFLKFYYKKREECDWGIDAVSWYSINISGTKLVQASWIFNLVNFQFRNFDVKDSFCSGPPIIGKIDEIMEKVVQDAY